MGTGHSSLPIQFVLARSLMQLGLYSVEQVLVLVLCSELNR